MKEQERKFKLNYLPTGLIKQEIQQGYLMLGESQHLRVRTVDGNKGYLTYKILHSPENRDEYEYEIPIQDAIELLSKTEIKLTKTRYKTTFENNTVDIDVYQHGLSVCEIEYTEPLTNLPDYCGEEITGIKKYSNIHIALYQTK